MEPQDINRRRVRRRGRFVAEALDLLLGFICRTATVKNHEGRKF